MAQTSRRGNLEFDIRMGRGSGAASDSDRPFRILILGDFSGRTNRGVCEPLAARRPFAADLDEMDAAVARLKVALRLEVPGEPSLALSFGEMADFHPDGLYAKLPRLAPLRDLRARLRNPATAALAAAEIRAWSKPASPPPAKPPPGPAAAPAAAGPADDPFAQLLGKRVASRGAAKTGYAGSPAATEFIRQIVQPHVVAAGAPDQAELGAALDAAAGRLLNAVLHHPDFQALEAAWRAVDFLVHNLELDENMSLWMLDVSMAELDADVAAGAAPNPDGLARILVREPRGTPGGVPWSVVVGLFAFGGEAADVRLLRRLGKVARQSGAPFLAAARYTDAGDVAARTADWAGLLSGGAGDYVGLAVPRLMLRLPYGAATDPADSFEFEEMPKPPAHGDYLWGNPAVACACLMGQTFRERGWPLPLGALDRLGGLPLHVWTAEGEKAMTPPAEFWLSDAEAEALIGRGLIPLMSVRGQDAISIPRFQSVSGRALPLGG